MIYVDLRKKICDLLKSKSTLLWLEGSKYEQVNQIQMKANKVILTLENGTIKLVQFDRYALTAVGVQFWNQGRPSVLYKWDFPENVPQENKVTGVILPFHLPDDDPTPPDVAA
jgi:hypothetical protein